MSTVRLILRKIAKNRSSARGSDGGYANDESELICCEIKGYVCWRRKVNSDPPDPNATSMLTSEAQVYLERDRRPDEA